MIPQVKITENGPVAPTREEVEAGLWSMMTQAFGENLNTDARTPQGQIVTSLTAALMREHNTQIEMLNQFDPRYAFGVYQEALGAIYFQSRRMATHSVANLEFIGAANVTAHAGFIVIDEIGHEWALDGIMTIGGDGTGTQQATCLTEGEISAAPNSILTFKETIDGLDRVTNPHAAVVGQSTESRLEFEARRIQSVAANAKNTNASVLGAVLNLPGVIDAYVIDNPTAGNVDVGFTDYTMPQHSLFVSVVGGDDDEIAWQVLVKGGTGCTFVGNTHVVVIDDNNDLALTHPEYNVYFERPAHVPVYFQVSVASTANISIASETAMKQSIMQQLSSGDNRARIGGIVIGSSYICGLAQDLKVIDIEVSLDGATWEKYLNFGVDQFPVSHVNNISLVRL